MQVFFLAIDLALNSSLDYDKFNDTYAEAGMASRMLLGLGNNRYYFLFSLSTTQPLHRLVTITHLAIVPHNYILLSISGSTNCCTDINIFGTIFGNGGYISISCWLVRCLLLLHHPFPFVVFITIYTFITI